MPGWRTLLQKDRFLPHVMVTAAIPTKVGFPGAKLPTLDRVAFAGEWLVSEGLLVDAAVSSTLEASRSLTGIPVRPRKDELLARWPHTRFVHYFGRDKQ
jgi:hypothetical protein